MFIKITTSRSVSKTANETRSEMSELPQFIDVSCWRRRKYWDVSL